MTTPDERELDDLASRRNEVELHPHSTWTDGSSTYQIVGVTIDDDELLVTVWGGRDDYRTVTIGQAMQMMVHSEWTTNRDLVLHADDDALLQTLPKAKYDALVALEQAILEARTGFPTRHPKPGTRPRPAYDPAKTTVGQRMRLMAAETGMSLAGFYNKYNAWDQGGRSALVHGNTNPNKDPLAKFDPELVEFVRGFVARHIGSSTKTKGHWRVILQLELSEAGFSEQTVSALKTLLNETTRGTGFFGDAALRRQKALKPKKGGRRSRPNAYGCVMEIDSTQLDFMIWSPGEQGWVRVWAIFLTDVATRTTSVRVTTSPPNARAFALTLARMMMPPVVPDMPRPWLFAPVAPVEIHVPEDMFAPEDDEPRLFWPPVIPNELHMDHGKEGENGHVLDICARLGITVVFARPRTATDKPHIESAIGKAMRFVQLVPGHKGNAVKNRGDHPEGETMLTFEAAQAVMDEACLQAMYEPHSGLPHPQDMGHFLTPTQAYNLNIMRGVPLRVNTNPNLIFEFLPAHLGTISGNEVTIDSIVYRATDPGPLKAISAGDSKVHSRQLIFRRDPNDLSRVFWHEPGSMRWHTLRAVFDSETLPPFSEITYAQLLKTAGAKRLGEKAFLNLRTLFLKHVRTLAKSKRRRQELVREFNRLCEALPDPVEAAGAPVPGSRTNTKHAKPPLHVVDGAAPSTHELLEAEGLASLAGLFEVDPAVATDGDAPVVPPVLRLVNTGLTAEGGTDEDDYELADYDDDDFGDNQW